jgi:hypothetical protein
LVCAGVQLVISEDRFARIYGQMVPLTILPHPVALVLEEMLQTLALLPTNHVLVPCTDQGLI